MKNINQTTIHGFAAEFDNPKELLHAAEKVRDAGYKKFDCHSPFPIHGMDRAMGEKRSLLGYIVAVAAVIGVGSALGMQWWMSAVDYKLVIAGKPFFSYQAFFPVTFSIAVLVSAGVAMFGMLGLIGVKFFHPIFYSVRIARVTDDGFFVSILANDKQFDRAKTKEFLESIGGKNVETLEENK